MSQRQCKKMRKFMRKYEKQIKINFEILDYYGRRPPVWKIAAYIRWKKEGREIFG